MFADSPEDVRLWGAAMALNQGIEMGASVPLESILCTDELDQRCERPPDYETENRALVTLAQAMADSPRTILQTLADIILDVFKCDSAGISLLTKDEKRFYWPAIAGVWKPHVGGGTPRDFGPCGDVLDHDIPLMFRHFERRYDYLQPVTPLTEECLLVPFHVAGKAVGTIWAIAHDQRCKFDAEDRRQLVSLGRFASSAYQVLESLNLLEKQVDAVRESEERFHTLADNISQLAWMADARGRIYWYNRRWFDYTGTTLEEMQGWGWKQVQHPDHVERVVQRIQQSWDSGEAWEDTFPLRGKDGEYRWFLSRALPISDADGQIVRWFGTNTDISDFRAARQALRDSELRYRRLFQFAQDGVLILDAETGQIIDANACMSALAGLEHGELVGKQLYEIGLFHDIEANKRAFRELQENGHIRYDHLPLKNRHGETVPVEIVSNMYYEDQRPLAKCNVRDISERNRLEQQIARQAETLADESRRKDEFLAMLSHELRNPLASIRAAIHLLKLEERASENLSQRQAREVIERQVTNLTKLINDLLEVSRVVSGRIRLQQQTVDLNQVVRNALETAQPMVEQRRHKLFVNVGPEPVWASADAARLEEVFVNLLDNAAKYTDLEGRIEVWCERAGDRDHAQVRVRDNGVGIDETLLPQIFDLFTQSDRSLDRSAGGLGIGLSLAQRLVALHGGSIEAHSPPDGQSNGSEFVVQLPLLPTPEQPTSQTPVAEQHKPAGVRVLLVDDNHDLVMVLGRTLRCLGYNVQNAYTGPDGLAAAVQWRPDIVIMDIGLPGLNGYEVARRLRSDATLRNREEKMSLIALTGYGQLADIALTREAGFDAHLTKPYELDELEKLLLSL
jgi:PAS domain S-box-containing protein